METSIQQSIFSEIADFLVSQPSLEELANYRVSPAIQQHLDMLLDKNSEGTITSEERLELDKILAIGSLMNLAKVKAKLKMVGTA
jgi:hypothetical protein